MILKKIKKILKWVVVLFFSTTILAVVAYRFIPVYITPLMVIRCFQQVAEGESVTLHHHWVSMDKISAHMPGKVHGASTISQQTAKNVFLWPGRSWTRKGFEAYFTFLIEMMWSKQRIMEVYLNSIEMGDGIYGVDAVAEYHFDKEANDLFRSECALIAATLPNPRKFNSEHPSRYMRKRQRQIEHEMRFIPAFPKEGEDLDPNTAVGGYK